MPGRRLPSGMAETLGISDDTPLEKVLTRCALAGMSGEACLGERVPLAAAMAIVAREVEGVGMSLSNPDGAHLWIEAMQAIQAEGEYLGQDRFLPCRACGGAFQPVIGTQLLALFRGWWPNGERKKLLPMHRCPGCRGTLPAHAKAQPGAAAVLRGLVASGAGLETDDDWLERLLEGAVW